MTIGLKDLLEALKSPWGPVVIVAILGYWWLRKEIRRIGNVMDGHAYLNKLVISALSKKKIIDQKDLLKLVENKDAVINRLFKEEEKEGNPLSHAELEQLRAFYERIKNGDQLSIEEVNIYNALVEKLRNEKPGNEGTWALVALGALILGMAIGSGSSKPKRRRRY